jgi:two-component system CheB/CheR fusion protein
MLSHELRNPMGAVLNALQVLGSLRPSAAVSEDALGVIQRQTRHMARLLDDLLDVARIGQSKIEFRKEVFDLGELADDVLDSVSYELAAKQQTLHATICRGPLLVHADPARIKQAQLNLLTNASKYTPEKGDIWYDLERDAAEAVITVRDSGQGISRELLDCIFDLFVQSETNLDRSSGGMGVGLWLARTIVEAHAGTIHAESEGSGRGSRFRIQLPLTDQPRKLPPPPSHIRVRGHRLLLVEDNEDARTMLATTMELEGFTVEAAGDGETALARFRDFQPDVAVIDIGLPVMDGYQLAQGIRNLDVQRQTLLIALTGYGRESDRQAALDAGFDAHLVKPLDPTALYALIADRQHATRAVQQSS